MKTPIPYYGAKIAMAKRIVKALPAHDYYVEPFCGSAAVFFAARPAQHSYLYDLNPWPIAALRAIRDEPERLMDTMAGHLDHSEWRRSVIEMRLGNLTGDDVKDGAICIAAYGSSWDANPWASSCSKRGCDRYNDMAANGKMRWMINEASARLQGADIRVAEAIDAIEWTAHEGTMIFCDPPYMKMEFGGGSRGGHDSGYGPWEPPDRAWHERFLDKIAFGLKVGASFALTTGDDDLYKERLGELGFTRASATKSKQQPGLGGQARATHLLWVNHNTNWRERG